jgi:hypothetical protein
MDSHTIFVYLLPSAIALTGLVLAFKSNILKDGSADCDIKPYSFSNTQLLWWTLIIVCTFSIYYGEHLEMLELTRSSLILLGISLGTTTAAKIIDNTDKTTKVSRHQDNNSVNFIIDIISDENGISVHRFQAFVFNTIFGLIFLNYFFTEHKFIEFGDLELTLMGISSAAYLGLKATENKEINPPAPPANNPAPPTDS